MAVDTPSQSVVKGGGGRRARRAGGGAGAPRGAAARGPAPPTPRPRWGRPTAATTVAVLDRHGGPVPPGTPGELVIGGAGVTDGYLGRAAAAARAARPHPPTAPVPGASASIRSVMRS
ncbi:AMP-binding protein, partial [Streptomyces sp. NPDC059810]|uniref:AMP-binding protein n=1 Tax=Streptomyces sp. NPDC059810 TaxID=3346956 RepID=UPI003654D043